MKKFFEIFVMVLVTIFVTVSGLILMYTCGINMNEIIDKLTKTSNTNNVVYLNSVQSKVA